MDTLLRRGLRDAFWVYTSYIPEYQKNSFCRKDIVVDACACILNARRKKRGDFEFRDKLDYLWFADNRTNRSDIDDARWYRLPENLTCRHLTKRTAFRLSVLIYPSSRSHHGNADDKRRSFHSAWLSKPRHNPLLSDKIAARSRVDGGVKG